MTQQIIEFEAKQNAILAELAEDPAEVPAASPANAAEDLSGATRGEGLEEEAGESRSSEETTQDTDTPRGAAAGK